MGLLLSEYKSNTIYFRGKYSHFFLLPNRETIKSEKKLKKQQEILCVRK